MGRGRDKETKTVDARKMKEPMMKTNHGRPPRMSPAQKEQRIEFELLKAKERRKAANELE